MSNLSLKPSHVTEALQTAHSAKLPAFIWGPPGIGKSQVVAQFAERAGLEFRDIRVTLLDPVDLRGLPKIEGGRTKWNPPDWLPTGGKGIFFWDELNAGAQMVQTAAYQSLLDNRIGEYVWPEGWYQCAAGNNISDGAAAQRMSTALKNRFAHIDMHADLDDWIQWASKKGIDSNIIAFLKWKPAELHNHHKDHKAFPTPRSWEFVSRLLEKNPGGNVEKALIAGTVGEGTMAEFYAFLELARKLPDLKEIWAKPEKANVPKEPATKYAVTYALALRCDKNTLKATLTYFNRLPLEFNVLGSKAVSERGTWACNQDFADHVVKAGIGAALQD